MPAFGNLFGSDYSDSAGVSSEGVPDPQTLDGFHEEAEVTESNAPLFEGETDVAALLDGGAGLLDEHDEANG